MHARKLTTTARAALAPETGTVPHRIFVVEDHELMRRGLIAALEREPDLRVCGQAESAGEAFAAIVTQQPDVVVTDLELSASSGLTLIEDLRAQAPTIPVIAITMFNVGESERRARVAGAAGFVAKQFGPGQMIAAVRAVLRTAPDVSRNPFPGTLSTSAPSPDRREPPPTPIDEQLRQKPR